MACRYHDRRRIVRAKGFESYPAYLRDSAIRRNRACGYEPIRQAILSRLAEKEKTKAWLAKKARIPYQRALEYIAGLFVPPPNHLRSLCVHLEIDLEKLVEQKI